MAINDIRLRRLLTIDEGLRFDVYLDSQGNPTVGYGHLVVASDELQLGDTISPARAEAFFQMDIAEVEDELVQQSWFIPLDDVRQTALADMTFNIGITKEDQFVKMIAALQAQDYSTAGDEMLDSLWARQVGQRAVRLSNIIRSGAYA